MKTHQMPKINVTANNYLAMSLELSLKQWIIGFTDGINNRFVHINALATTELLKVIETTKLKFALSSTTEVYSCYEAGRDGNWLHRFLISNGIQNRIIDPSSIEVPRRARRAKTDNLDVKSMLRLLLRYLGGEYQVMNIVHVPTREQEANRNLHRELEQLKKERTQHTNRIGSYLALEGLSFKATPSAMKHKFLAFLENAVSGDGHRLLLESKIRLHREHARYLLLQQQINEIELQQSKALIAEDLSPALEKVKQLMKLKGIGITSAWLLIFEFFAYRKFSNGKQVGCAAGLTAMPYQSGTINMQQGISKAGNRRIRKLMIQVAWRWLRHQPDSDFSRWYNQRYALGNRKQRKIGIVAVARKLLVALWRYLENGSIPNGAARQTPDQIEENIMAA